MATRYLALDCETGGIGSGLALLTVYLAAIDRDTFEVVDELDLRLKPDDGVYRVTAEAMSVNRIDLIAHDAAATPYKNAKAQLFSFLERNAVAGASKLLPLGHGVKEDILWVQEHLISRGSWDKFVSYRLRDTATGAAILIDAGVLPSSVSGSLESLVNHFGVPRRAFHTAKGDTLMTVDVYRAELELVKA